MRTYLWQVLILNDKGCVKHGQLLSVLNEIAQFAVLLSQLLHLEIALKDVGLSRLLLLCKACLEKILRRDPLI